MSAFEFPSMDTVDENQLKEMEEKCEQKLSLQRQDFEKIKSSLEHKLNFLQEKYT